MATNASGRPKASVRGKGGNLALPPLPLATPVLVQLQITGGACLEATYATPSRNDAGRFKARGL